MRSQHKNSSFPIHQNKHFESTMKKVSTYNIQKNVKHIEINHNKYPRLYWSESQQETDGMFKLG